MRHAEMNEQSRLADVWRQRCPPAKAKDAPDPEEERRWADGVIARITAAIQVVKPGQNQIEVGEFRSRELPHCMGEFYPTRPHLKGGALIVYDFCVKEGLHLFVGGDFKPSSGAWNAPYEIIVRLER